MRILIVTDSLGMPRENIPAKDVWVEKLMNVLTPHTTHLPVWYIISRRSLTMKNIASNWLYEIKLLSPDVLIIQAGICDCCRRVVVGKSRYIIERLPFINKVFHRIFDKFHYFFTSLYCVRSTTPEKFKQSIKHIVKYIEDKKIPVAFIRIASPGDALIKKVYNCKQDIKFYNDILDESIGGNVQILDPYAGHDIHEYILEEDGHHLSVLGNQIVFEKILSWIRPYTL